MYKRAYDEAYQVHINAILHQYTMAMYKNWKSRRAVHEQPKQVASQIEKMVLKSFRRQDKNHSRNPRLGKS
jgi:uncharacterized protein (DUF4415 family)